MKKIYILGLLFVFLHTTVTGQWSIMEMPKGRFYHGAVAVNGKLVIAGGFGNGLVATNSVNIYDIASETWSEATLSQARGFMGAVVHDGKAYFAGGGNYSGGVSDRIDVYDANEDEWTQLSLSQPRLGVGAAVAGDKLIFAGGSRIGSNFILQNTTDLVEIYDPDTGDWEYRSLSQPRSFMAIATAGDKIFFAGGNMDGNGFTNVVDIYDYVNDTWTVDTLSIPRSDISAVAAGDKVLFVGGISLVSDGYNLVDIYDLNTGDWSISYLPGGQRGGDMAKASFKGKAYFIGGSNYFLFDNWRNIWDQVSIYDPANDSWETETLMHSRVAAVAAVWEDQLFVCSGFNWSAGNLNSVEIYTDTATVMTSLSDPISRGVHLYPNPARDFLTLELPEGNVNCLEILDMEGRRRAFHSDVQGPQVTVRIEGLPNGTYFVRLWNEEQFESYRFVKME